MLLVEADKESQDGLSTQSPAQIAKASILYLSNHTSRFHRTDEASLLTPLCSLPNALVFGKGAGFTLLSSVVVHPGGDGKA